MKHNYLKDNIVKFAAAMRDAVDHVKNGDPAYMQVRISHGNVKMGEIQSVSMLPGLTCPACCHNTCGPDCYAAKIANLRPYVLRSYAINTAIALLRPDLYWKQINMIVGLNRYFRFHVSGDIIDKTYFSEMVNCAINNPHCQILAFTKQFEIINAWIDENGDLPENLHILFSGWTNLKPINPHGMPETNIFDENNAPKEDWLICGGNCSECICRGVGCWQVLPGQTIAFKKH